MNFADRERLPARSRSAKALVDRRQDREPRDGATPSFRSALPIVREGTFRGMCAVGISLQAALPTGRSAKQTARPVSAVAARRSRRRCHRRRRARRCRRLPVAARVADVRSWAARSASPTMARMARSTTFSVRPLGGNAALCHRCRCRSATIRWPLLEAWAGFFLVLLASSVVLLVIWFGADRWCVRPLRYIQDFAGKVARGETVHARLRHGPGRRKWPRSAPGVTAMAEAIASREAELRAGLEQRDHMLREIHHRVKNNLQMISSLLNLQAGEIRSPRIRRFFGDAQNRVLTLSILHRHLYERSSWSLVDFQQFISDLVRQISVGRAPDEQADAALSYPRADHGGRSRYGHSGRPDRDRSGQHAPSITISAASPRPRSASRRSRSERARSSSSSRTTASTRRRGRGPDGRARQFRPDPDPRSGHAAGRRGHDIAARAAGGTRVVVTFPMPDATSRPMPSAAAIGAFDRADRRADDRRADRDRRACWPFTHSNSAARQQRLVVGELRDDGADARDGDRGAGRRDRPARLPADRRHRQPRAL